MSSSIPPFPAALASLPASADFPPPPFGGPLNHDSMFDGLPPLVYTDPDEGMDLEEEDIAPETSSKGMPMYNKSENDVDLRATTPGKNINTEDKTLSESAGEHMDKAPLAEGEDDKVCVVDWNAIERECGLSAWDKLGKVYEADPAKIAEK
ncbi:hypothetical protein B0H34DRAFT_798936 [Crassisporium funariophilum]|nr:hypothetical protein B0H34DRAFT_798936 [Crassisporium funariophilum]